MAITSDIEELKHYLENLPKLNDTNRLKRKRKALRDFWFFIKTYFPHHIDNARKETSFFRDFIHKNIEGLTNKHREILFTAYRSGAKTTTISNLYNIWKIIKKDKSFSVLFSATDTLAKEILELNTDELQFNASLKSDFDIEVIKVTEKKGIIVKIDDELANMRAYGAGVKVRGIRFKAKRPDLIITDDIENDENVESKAQRDKLYKWYKKVVKKLVSIKDPSYNIINIGTILHHDSVLARLSKSVDYYRNFPLVLDFDSWTIDDSSLDVEEIKKEYREDKDAFYQERQNMPMSRDSLTFFGYKIIDHMPICDFYSIGIDPSLGKKNGDYFAIAIIGYKQDAKQFYLSAKGYKQEPLKLIPKILAIYIKYQALARTILSIETVQFQKFFKDVVKKEANILGIHPIIKEIKNTINKDLRIQSLSIPIIEGDILIDNTSALLIDELDTYPKSPHDDILDASEMAYRGFSFAAAVDYQKINAITKNQKSKLRKIKDQYC